MVRLLEIGTPFLCIHKGLLPKDYETSIPGGAWKYANVDDLPKAAKDWPQINFVIYHSALRAFLALPWDCVLTLSGTNMQWHRVTSTIKNLPERMFRVGFEITHFDHHPVRWARAVSADLSADPLP